MNRKLLVFGVAVVGGALAYGPVSAQEPVQMRTPQGSGARAVLSQPSKVRVPMETRTVKGAPYSAEVVTESVQVLPDGNRIVKKSTGRVYRDSQGRTRREEDREPGVVASVSVSDPVANTAFSLDPNSKTAWKSGFRTAFAIATNVPPPPPPPPAPDAPPAPPADPAELERSQTLKAAVVAGRGGGRGGVYRMREPAWEEKTEKLAARNIEGVMAEGTRTTRTIPAGAIGNELPIVTVTEEWRSPELQVLVLTRTSDPRTGETTYKLLNINRSEPNQSWFEVPADYTVRESGINRLEATRE